MPTSNIESERPVSSMRRRDKERLGTAKPESARPVEDPERRALERWADDGGSQRGS